MAAAAVVAAGGWLGACSDDPPALATRESTLTQLGTTPPPTTTPAAPATPATPATTDPPATTKASTTTTIPIDPVIGCMDYLTFQISAGEEEATELWQDLDESEDALVAECQRLAAEEPARVRQMIEEKRAIDEFLANAADD